jgi:hypothetical protein
MGEEERSQWGGPVSAREKKKEANRFFSVTSGMVCNFTPTLSAPRIGGVPLGELKKKLEWS